MRRLRVALAAAVALGCALPYAATAQICGNFCYAPPSPSPTEAPGVVNNSVNAGLFDLGSSFLWKQVNGGGTPSTGDQSTGGGASPNDQVQQRFRSWGEGYGLWSKTSDFDGIIGDSRRTAGLVGGFGYTVTPSVNVGFAVDQSWTNVAVNGLPQSAQYGLTQLGANSQITFGKFTLGLAGVYGFADVDTSRGTVPPTSVSVAAYNAKVYAAMADLGYFVPLGNARFVPKVAIDWIRVAADGFSEVGGFDPETVAPQTSDRVRAYLGFEVGQTWVADKTLFDLSGYARFVDILSETGFSVLVTSAGAPGVPETVQGATEGHYGLDAGASASVRVSQALRFYVNYDTRLRDHYQAQIGTVGVEVKW
ncbi:MAG TPA: autotransporter outer membrane beta-barrel domain-containing protein [Xanthobacteraceae bacterium]|nr:autotransporter outer membrane beta-barrel domain-containing protein [Xanthobacteraceae bacterium]